MDVILRFLICFALGSIPFAVISMLGSGIDIRKVGSGNPGFNNVLRVNKKRAMLALVGDMGKGYLALWLVLKAWPAPHPPLSAVALAWIYGFGAVLGHCYSPALKFNGGKGIATSGGVMLAIYPAWASIALAYFVIARITGAKLKLAEAGAVASLSTWILFTVLMLLGVSAPDALGAALMTAFLGWRHKSNLQRLVSSPVRSQKKEAVRS